MLTYFIQKQEERKKKLQAEGQTESIFQQAVFFRVLLPFLLFFSLLFLILLLFILLHPLYTLFTLLFLLRLLFFILPILFLCRYVRVAVLPCVEATRCLFRTRGCLPQDVVEVNEVFGTQISHSALRQKTLRVDVCNTRKTGHEECLVSRSLLIKSKKHFSGLYSTP